MSAILGWLHSVLVAIGLASAPAPIAYGYVEGEFVLVAAPEAGTLAELAVKRGEQVGRGQALFALDLSRARAERDRAAAALAQARAARDDLAKGQRPEELEVIAARRSQAEAALRLAEVTLRRQQTLAERGVTAAERLDEARAVHERDQAQLREMHAQMAVAQMAAREDQRRAAEDAVAMAAAALVQTERRLAELAPVAPQDALVDDTLYRPGEFVPAGAPVVSLLPPGNVKLRFFVPEALAARVAPGAELAFGCDGCPGSLRARVDYVAPRVEYTPPVVYSIGSREKLVFRVEARPLGGPALPPGLPITVTLPGTAP